MIWEVILNALGSAWWLIALVILMPLAHNAWIAWRQELFKSNVKHVLLEIHIPREIRKNPKAMEQVLTQIHSLGNYPNDIKEYNWDGEITLWHSFELVSLGGEIHFYIRTPRKYQDIVEAAFFSYYPDVEITEAEDYLNKIPETMQEVYKKNYELWGTEMVLGKDPAYPLRTYEDFESPSEEKEYDPISVFLEVLSKVKKSEFVGIQFVCAPTLPPRWRKRGEKLVEELKEKTSGNIREVAEGAADITKQFHLRTPGEIELIKAVEKNIERHAFNTLVRFIYLSPKDTFYEGFPRRGIRGAFNQYSALNLNYFINNYAVETRTRIWNWPHILPKSRVRYRKQRMIYNYRRPKPPPETFIGKLISSYFFNWNFGSKSYYLNTQAMATLFHPPMYYVLTAPHIKRLPSRKLGASAGLSIFSEEEKGLEKFELK
ncbi:MAG: hypothetical protein UV58_C0003G0029 [Candidatus Wolfebacteria bacterium GW2011_GWC1_43_10]|uniref:DUF8128 domain-containing protein n=2 Tax=Candidatus Wolfeibacteriota TaxID=1752735 RepID=A0A0G1CBB6_9BACT|nr:MAG: hypothetical protein UV58_C0003G0029 [Candidatus Wolfebacteria bacterium GW2011_GWC1_43_10]OGM89095.1 MAG: hypothetical protein A2108_02590 [Candidatus Wolfebacteria bacterium GWA1_42_9]